MIKLGITGGIATGKTVVSKLFTELGVIIIDADVIAKELTTKNTLCYEKILIKFGNDYLLNNNELDRKKIANTIFSNYEYKVWLENLLHPLIFDKMNSITESLEANICAWCIPLLVEKNLQKSFHKVIVVDCKKRTQLSRLIKRDNLTLSQANLIIANQIDRYTRLKYADYVLQNDKTISDLKKQLVSIYNNVLLS